MFVRQHMSAPAITITPDTDFKTALRLMQQHRIRHLPVVDAAGALAGVVAQGDLLLAAERFLTSPVDVERFMTRDVATVGEGTTVLEAATLMVRRKIGSLPVVNGSRMLLGIVTETDLLKALAAMLAKDPRASAGSAKWPARGTASRKKPAATLGRERGRSAS